MGLNKRPSKPDLPKLIKDAKEKVEKNEGKQNGKQAAESKTPKSSTNEVVVTSSNKVEEVKSEPKKNDGK